MLELRAGILPGGRLLPRVDAGRVVRVARQTPCRLRIDLRLLEVEVILRDACRRGQHVLLCRFPRLHGCRQGFLELLEIG